MNITKNSIDDKEIKEFLENNINGQIVIIKMSLLNKIVQEITNLFNADINLLKIQLNIVNNSKFINTQYIEARDLNGKLKLIIPLLNK